MVLANSKDKELHAFSRDCMRWAKSMRGPSLFQCDIPKLYLGNACIVRCLLQEKFRVKSVYKKEIHPVYRLLETGKNVKRLPLTNAP